MCIGLFATTGYNRVMKSLLRSLAILLAVTFATNIVASPTLAANACNKKMAATAMEEAQLPCHKMQEASAGETQKPDKSGVMDCTKCCDYCKLMSSVVLPASSVQHGVTKAATLMLMPTGIDSSMPHGIEYPPRSLS